MKQLIALTFLSALACSGSGGNWQHYRISALAEARERGMTIYLHFYESGNPTCEKQKVELETLIKDKAYAKVGAYRVNYESEKALENTFGVTQPCSLLVFKGENLKTKISSDVGPELLKIALQQGL